MPTSDSAVTVRSEVVQPGDVQRINVDWRIRFSGEALRVVDVVVEGTSLIQTVRSDFGSTVRQGEGDVSALIAALREKVEALKADATVR